MLGIMGSHLRGLGGPEGSGGHVPTPWLLGDVTVGESLFISGSQFSHL